MKYLAPIILLTVFTACLKTTPTFTENKNLPYIETAWQIEYPEDCIPLKVTYQNEEVSYIVGDKPTLLKDLEDSVAAYLKEHQALAFRLQHDKEWGDVLNLRIQADSTVPYQHIFALIIYSNVLSFDHLIWETKSLDNQEEYGIKRSLYFYPFDETHDYIAAKHQIKGTYDPFLSEKIQKILRNADTSSVKYDDDIEIEIPRQSEPPPPPPPPPTDILSIFRDDVFDHNYVEKLNPVFMNLTQKGINYLDGETIDEEEFDMAFKDILYDIKDGNRSRTTMYNEFTNKLADIYIMLSVEDDVPYHQWLKMREFLTDTIERKGLDVCITDSCPFEIKAIEEAIKQRK